MLTPSKVPRSLVIVTLLIAAASGCTSGRASTAELHCNLSISVSAHEYARAEDVRVRFSLEGATSVLTLASHPEVVHAEPDRGETVGTEASKSAVTFPEPPKIRDFDLYGRLLWTMAWDRVEKVDPEGGRHILPGLYRIQLVYFPQGRPGRSERACVAMSAPFRVLRESVWVRWVD